MSFSEDNIFNNNENLYEILEISPNSSEYEIKKAYRKLALKFHPDKNNGFYKDKFIKIKYAYDILSDNDLKKKYDNKLQSNKYFFDINNLNLFFLNYIKSTEINKILKILLKKQIKSNEIYTQFLNKNNLSNFHKEISNIYINVDFSLKDIWYCIPKLVVYKRETKNIFNETIYPIDFEQIYENEGEEIKINNIVHIGDLIIKINIKETNYNNENYFIYENELYLLINKNRIINNKFTINFIDDNKYKFNINKLKLKKNKLGNVYTKKNFGLLKYCSENVLSNGNLFFIFVI